MGCSKDFLRRIYSNKLSEPKLDLLYTLCTELDLVVNLPITRYDFEQYNKALQMTADEAKFENKPEAWTELERLENLWKRNRKKYVPKDLDLLPEVLTFNF